MSSPPLERVVAAAIVTDGRLLSARRRRPEQLAGKWELPGGKTQAGEDEAAALARELDEELAIQATIGPLLGRTSISSSAELAIFLCVHFTGTPTLGPDHDALRWVTAAEAPTLDWLPADQELLPAVSRHL